MRRLQGQPTVPFRYRDKGSLATIGRAAGVGQIGGLKVSGFLAWWLWWCVHIAYLIGYRNRLVVMMGWAFQYFAFSRGARLITGAAWEPGADRRAQAAEMQAVPGKMGGAGVAGLAAAAPANSHEPVGSARG